MFRSLLVPPDDCVPPTTADDDAVQASPSLHWSETAGWSSVEEKLATEAPLTLEIAYKRAGQEIRKVLAVTMRTPGHDDELALGFLFAEGLIDRAGDVTDNAALSKNSRGERLSTRRLRLARAPREDLQRVSRGLITSSACGLCGRVSLDGLPLRRATRRDAERPLEPALLARLPDTLRRHQPLFFGTGGSHGAALCGRDGQLYLIREDVGRHNAVDKLVGAALAQSLAFDDNILVLSGRASFELLQKAAVAGIPFVVAVGAPSSLAVTLAHAADITLAGFARGDRLNVYTHADRLAVAEPLAASRSRAP
jgi:FdhD protein